MPWTVDYVIVGAGIVGLAIARELKARQPHASIMVLEKESGLGKHASGRNSGVLHSGIFYAEDSVKAKVCAQGGKELSAYCLERKLPLYKSGKVIVPTQASDAELLERLFLRGKTHGISVEMIDSTALSRLEPDAYSVTGKALHLPEVSVVDPAAILNQIVKEIKEAGVEFVFNFNFLQSNPQNNTITLNGDAISYGHLFNCAGLYADRVAHRFGVGENYTILPFKGIYYRVSPNSPVRIHGLIYALPDPRVPFLGIHTSRNTHDEVYFGPTVVPALGRENYEGFAGIQGQEAMSILGKLMELYWENKQDFRRFAHREALRFLKRSFFSAARKLIPKLRMEDLLPSRKVGIRAQLLDLKKRELVMDFLFENGKNSTHILNAVSPAFTSSFAFARLVLDQIGIH